MCVVCVCVVCVCTGELVCVGGIDCSVCALVFTNWLRDMCVCVCCVCVHVHG